MNIPTRFAIGLASALVLASHPAQAGNVSIAPEAKYAADVSGGIDALRAGDPAKAVESFDRAIARYEHDYPAGIFRCASNSDDAVKVAILVAAETPDKDVTILGPNWCTALWGKGFALIDLNRLDQAEAALARSVEMAPTNAHYMNEYAELFKSRREWQRSYDMFARAFAVVDQDPKGPDASVAARALRGMGFTKIELGDLDAAERLFKRSLEFQPNHPGAQTELRYIAQKRATGS